MECTYPISTQSGSWLEEKEVWLCLNFHARKLADASLASEDCTVISYATTRIAPFWTISNQTKHNEISALSPVTDRIEKLMSRVIDRSRSYRGGWNMPKVACLWKNLYQINFFWQKKMNGRGPWEKIILSDHGNPLMGNLRCSSEVPKFIVHLVNSTSFFQT